MIKSDRVLTANPQNQQEQSADRAIRPRNFADYFGQDSLKEQLIISIKACLNRQDSLDHILLFGPPGLGKTTLAGIIASELGVNLQVTSGPVLDKAHSLAAILTNLQQKDVLFIDEIHRLNPAVEEILYPAMEDFSLDIMVGEGAGARSIPMKLPPFTLIGATTRSSLLSAPLRDRFGIVHHLQFYNPDQLQQIVTRSAKMLSVAIDAKGAYEIGSRSRGTPRIANRILRRVRDYAQVVGNGLITAEIANEALILLGIDQKGLDNLDRKLLAQIIDYFDGGPVGIDTLSASIGEDAGTLEQVIEPYLIQNGFLQRTRQGRIATKLAYLHLEKESK